jgi:hypothetical protein
MTSKKNITLPARICLNHWEFSIAIDCANKRMAISNDSEMNNAKTYKRGYMERLNHDVLGVCGEMAVCKALGRFWSPSVNTFHKIADIPPNIEVRSTDHPKGSLIVRDDDPDNRWYFLVHGEPPNLTVVGFMHGSAAKQDRWLDNPGGRRESWFVPQSELLTERPKEFDSAAAGTDPRSDS